MRDEVERSSRVCHKDRHYLSLQPYVTYRRSEVLEMSNAAVLFATGGSIFAAPALLLLIAALSRSLLRRSPPLDRNDGSSSRSASAATDTPLEIKHLGVRAEPEP